MKALKVVAILLCLFFLLWSHPVLAGQSYSKSTAETYVGSDGQSYIRLETEVNGEKKVFETTEPGSYSLEQGTPSPTSFGQPTSSPTSRSPEFEDAEPTIPTIPNIAETIRTIFETIKNIFANLFGIL